MKKSILVFAFLMCLDVGLIFMNIPPVLKEFMTLYGVSYTSISILISALLWSHTAMVLPAGMIVDRLGIGRTMLISLIGMCAGNILPVLSSSFALAVVGRVVTGFGTGTSFLATMTMVALYAPKHRTGSYQAFYGGVYALGNVTAYLVIPRLTGFGWQWSYILPGGISLLLLPMLALLRLDPTSPTRHPPLPLRKIVSSPAAWVLGSYLALSWGSMLNLGNWVPSLLEEVWNGSSATELAWGGALVMLISGLARLCGGIVLLRLSAYLIANGSIFVLGLLFLFLFVSPIPGTVLFLAVLAAWFSSVSFGAFFHLASRSTSSDSLGTFLGFLIFLANLCAVLFTLMFGWMKDNFGSFSWGFFVLAVLCLLAFFPGRRTLRDHRA